MRKWFLTNPIKSKNIISGLNKKYGNFDFKKSSRILYEKSFKEFLSRFNVSTKKVILVGGNDGHEAEYLLGKPSEVFVVDLAKDALKKVKGKNIYPIFSSAEELPFLNNYFDFYFAFRTLFSKHIDLDISLEEAKRVVRAGGTIVVSIPNGFLVDDEIANGMFDYDKNEIDKELPFKMLESAFSLFKKLKFKNVQKKELPGEILLFAKK